MAKKSRFCKMLDKAVEDKREARSLIERLHAECRASGVSDRCERIWSIRLAEIDHLSVLFDLDRQVCGR